MHNLKFRHVFNHQFKFIGIDLEQPIESAKGGCEEAAEVVLSSSNSERHNGTAVIQNMSVCVESTVVASQASTTHPNDAPPSQSQLSDQQPQLLQSEQQPQASAPQQQQQPQLPQQALPQQTTATVRTITKIPASNAALSKASFITVLNTPLGNVKSLCVTPAVSTGQFTVVNSAAPLNISNNPSVKPQTITLINTPVTVVKTIPPGGLQQQEKNVVQDGGVTTQLATTVPMPALIENRGHNVFVKNTASCVDGGASPVITAGQQDLVPQSHKLLTANNFPTNNVLTTAISVSDVGVPKPVNGQRNKVKILQNVLMPGPSQPAGNILLNKANSTAQLSQRYMPRQKLVASNNGATTKYLNKPPSTLMNKSNIINPTTMCSKQQMTPPTPGNSTGSIGSGGGGPPQRVVYPTHKSQIKTIPPVNNYMHKGPSGSGGSGGGGGGGGIKTLPPHMKGIPGAPVQRTGSGLRTIPPQRPHKPPPNKPNYIGKHAVQAQKMKPTHKPKATKLPPQSISHHGPPPMFNNFHSSAGPVLEKHLTFNQALTAEILETLGNGKSGANCSHPTSTKQSYEILPPRYDNSYYQAEAKSSYDSVKPIMEKRIESGLDTLSLICQAVLLDHNYYAPPRESPSRSVPPVSTQAQINGVSVSNLYSPTTAKRRSLPTSNSMSAATSLTNLSSLPSNSNSMIQEDDAASDISDDNRKHDTEGEETDTAPEVEDVNNQEDQFGDYVTRCICNFLHDDGYMIECDRCKVWQHVQCVVKNKQVPDDYLCEMCDPQKSVDRSKARLMQQQWLRDRQFADPKLRKETKFKEVFNKRKESISDSDSSDGELTGGHNNNVMGKSRAVLPNRRKNDTHPKGNNARQRRDSVKEPTVQKRQTKKRERKVVKRKAKTPVKNHSDDENHDSVNSSTPLPQFRQWLDQYEDATTNHYSPELRARISNIRVNGALHSELVATTPPLDCPVEKCRVHVQPLTNIKHLYTTVSLAPNTPVVELRGKYMLSTQHRTTGSTLNTRQHAQRPGPFVFFYRLHKENTEVCVDTRTYGNSARFIRRSCKPNAELRHSIVKSALHLYIVTIADVDKNVELTIKHESHDLAAIGTTHIACACGNPDECTVNKSTIKKNGDSTEMHKKRRGRRTISTSAELEPPLTPTNTKVKRADSLPSPVPTSPIKAAEPVDVKIEKVEEPAATVVSTVEPEVCDVVMKPEKKEKVTEEVEENKVIAEDNKPLVELKKEIKEEDEKMSPQLSLSPTPSQVSTRRSSHKADKDDSKESDSGREASSVETTKNKNKKLSREERKLEAILRAIEQMEKADQRKQEHQAKQAHRRESEPTTTPSSKEEEKLGEPKVKRRRRKGRARTTSTNTPTSGRRNRLNSTDSYLTSGDETMLSPRDDTPPSRPSLTKDHHHQSDVGDKDVGLLLALSNGGAGDKNKSPHRDGDSNSNSNSVQSSPETQLSSACLLVQAAVEPMEPGFKFPKTKKGLMNEWLNKAPEPVQSASSISPSSLTPHINTSSNSEYESNFYTPGKSLVALAQVASFCDTTLQSRGGSAKKRWLRQAISEDQCDSPSGRPDSPTLSDSVAPPKKRRLPRESLSNDNTPPTTPTSVITVTHTNERQQSQEGCVEIVYSGADDDSPSQTLESDAVLEERAAEMKEEFAKFQPPPPPSSLLKPSSISTTTSEFVTAGGCLADPRLARDHHPHHLFTNSEHLVGTVEKTLSILGFEDRKPEAITPAKRKLSITEYRQRKKINNNDKNLEEQEQEMEQSGPDENSSSELMKQQQLLRPRSNSTSSCTSMTSSDDEAAPLELAGKAPSAFNSEPTELERQREITSMRLKKAFGITLPQEPKKTALDVDAILNCEIPPMVKTIPPCPNFPIPGSCDGILSKGSALSPSLDGTASPGKNPAVMGSVPPVAVLEPAQSLPMVVPIAKVPLVAAVHQMGEIDGRIIERKTMFYTPDEEEIAAKKSHSEIQGELEEATVDYVPPFNNPIYPNDSNFNAYTSSIDEEGRYEGRNPSPPPELETGGGATFQEQET